MAMLSRAMSSWEDLWRQSSFVILFPCFLVEQSTVNSASNPWECKLFNAFISFSFWVQEVNSNRCVLPQLPQLPQLLMSKHTFTSCFTSCTRLYTAHEKCFSVRLLDLQPGAGWAHPQPRNVAANGVPMRTELGQPWSAMVNQLSTVKLPPKNCHLHGNTVRFPDPLDSSSLQQDVYEFHISLLSDSKAKEQADRLLVELGILHCKDGITSILALDCSGTSVALGKSQAISRCDAHYTQRTP